MDTDSDVKIKLLDDLMTQMEDHQAGQYQKPQEVAVEEKKIEVTPPTGEEPKDKALKKAIGVPEGSEKKTYLNPDREKLLKEVEETSSLPRGFQAFVKSRRA